MKLNSFQKMLSTIFILFSIFSFQAQTVIDFDAVRDPTAQLNTEIQRIIRTNPGAIIEFKSPVYDLDNKGLNIPTEITLKGITDPNVTIDLSGRGADNSNIQTKFINCNIITFRSNNIRIEGLEFEKTTGPQFNIFFNLAHPTYNDQDLDTNGEFTGIELDNVRIVGGGYAVRAGNGFGGSFNNVSIVNFNVIGVWFNRIGNVNEHSRVDFTNCTFRPRNEVNSAGTPVERGSDINFNDRGISFDGGNTSYPIVWDHNDSTVEKCLFLDTGIGASSRGTNVIVNNNEFNDTQGIVELVRVEEFSSDFAITNNLFNCNNSQTNIITFDRELQGVSDITVSGNTVTGFYRYFIAAYAPNNLTITNNDFTNGNTNVGSAWVNLIFYENAGEEPIAPGSDPDLPGEFVTNGLTISGNTGVADENRGVLTVNLPTGNTGFSSDFPVSRTVINNFEQPKQLLSDGVYEIVNKNTTKNMIPNSGSDLLMTSNTFDDTAQWSITFIPPFTYTIQNVATNEYLELDIPFTESNIIGNPNNLPDLFPFAKNTFDGFTPSLVNRLPFWAFRKNGDQYVIFPGGNELQSAIAATPTDVVNLVAARQKAPNSFARIPVDLEADAMWSFRPVTDNYVSWNTSATREFLLGEVTTQEISYGVRKTDEVLQSVDFGLVVVDSSTDTIVEEVLPLAPVATAGDSNADTVSFDYTIPAGIEASNRLPNDQFYAVRLRLITKVNGTGPDIVEEIQLPVSIFRNITESEITWDSDSVTEFPLGSTSQQTISHDVLSTETPIFTQFGLFIVNTADNSVVSAIDPQIFPSTATNIQQRETKTFSYTVADNILPSAELPAGQRYAIRVILGTQDASGADKFTSEITPVTITVPNTIIWDTRNNTQFELGVTREQQVSYFFQPDQTFEFIQFGFIVRDVANNFFLREIIPQTSVPIPAGSNSGTQVFEYTTPPGIDLSSDLSAGEKYTLRTRLQTRDAAGNVVITISFTDVTVVEAGGNLVRWETFKRDQQRGVETTQAVSYRIMDDEELELVQFGLVITSTDNIFISEQLPQIAVATLGSPKQADNVSFQYTIPSNMILSRDLPSNQKYRMRIRVNYTDSAGQAQRLLQFVDVNVTDNQTLATPSVEIENKKLAIYPNPVAENLFISNSEMAIFSIYNISGQLILSAKTNDRINVESLTSGIYFLKSDTGAVLKFLKK
ncbi:T9SS type A sorting domain-containing protein [Aquimarina sp. ERC-38]|uniref:T9SS type A sorting domain-containing protein n=1 Tax=Aquimarina sp. ERC-38 TaxID=2949996 RepID=UPI0022461F1F|nr:T9SS type A sorting domain-containing protein [Aquimarina sp. ERC-38]UZO79809.1 T9SS type A sorting domain-containing protein [Aquimarina sp. ERC-38]